MGVVDCEYILIDHCGIRRFQFSQWSRLCLTGKGWPNRVQRSFVGHLRFEKVPLPQHEKAEIYLVDAYSRARIKVVSCGMRGAFCWADTNARATKTWVVGELVPSSGVWLY